MTGKENSNYSDLLIGKNVSECIARMLEIFLFIWAIEGIFSQIIFGESKTLEVFRPVYLFGTVG